MPNGQYVADAYFIRRRTRLFNFAMTLVLTDVLDVAVVETCLILLPTSWGDANRLIASSKINSASNRCQKLYQTKREQKEISAPLTFLKYYCYSPNLLCLLLYSLIIKSTSSLSNSGQYFFKKNNSL